METLATLTESEQKIAVASGAAGAMVGMYVMTILIWYVLCVIATWKIFKKANEPGWKSLIPIYNIYIMYKIVGMKGWFWGILIVNILLALVMSFDNTTYLLYENGDAYVFVAKDHIPTIIAFIVAFVVSLWGGILNAWRTSKAFGHGVGYFIGLLFFQPIFWLIIGFGKSKYSKKALKR